MNEFISHWKLYSVLWKNEKSQRELLGNCLLDFETALRENGELDTRLTTETNMHVIGQLQCVVSRFVSVNVIIVFFLGACIAISTERLKLGLVTEIKSCTHRLVWLSYFIFRLKNLVEFS